MKIEQPSQIHAIERRIQSVCLHIALLLVAATMIIPFQWMISTSMTENANTEQSKQPRFHPWREGNRLLASASKAVITAEDPAESGGMTYLTDGGMGDVQVWRSRPIPPGGSTSLLLDLGAMIRLSELRLISADVSKQGRPHPHLVPALQVTYAKNKSTAVWTDTLPPDMSARRVAAEAGYSIVRTFEPRLVSRFYRLTLTNTTAETLPVVLHEIEAIERLRPSLDNFAAVVNVTPEDRAKFGPAGRFGRYYLNSLFVAVLTTVGSLLFCSMAGYAFAKGKFLGRNVIFYAILATMMIPTQVTMIPVYRMMHSAGLLNSLWSLILPGLASAYAVFLCAQFIRQIPDSLLEAARLDGCSEFRIYWEIIVPLSKPVLATLGIVTFLYSWNNFLGPLIMLNDEKWQTLPLGLSTYRNQYTAEYGNMMAASAIAIIPILIVFVLLQKYVIKGMAHSGMKE